MTSHVAMIELIFVSSMLCACFASRLACKEEVFFGRGSNRRGKNSL